MRILSEEEINEDLKYNFPGQGIKIDSFIKPGNPFFAQSKEEAITGYTCGYSIREFLLKEGFRLSFSSREFLPIVFNLYRVRELYEICGQGKGPKGLDDLKDLGIINFELFGYGSDRRKVAFYVKNFENMKECLKQYANNKDFLPKNFSERFEENLGSIKSYINEISERSFEVYENAKEWYRSHKSLDGFKFNPRPLSLVLKTEESLVVI